MQVDDLTAKKAISKVKLPPLVMLPQNSVSIQIMMGKYMEAYDEIRTKLIISYPTLHVHRSTAFFEVGKV